MERLDYLVLDCCVVLADRVNSTVFSCLCNGAVGDGKLQALADCPAVLAALLIARRSLSFAMPELRQSLIESAG
jgi:hypothetical protein